MPKSPLTPAEALRQLLQALVDPASMQSRTRITKCAVELEAALRHQRIPEPAEVLDILHGFSLASGLIKPRQTTRRPVIGGK
jgi:hypothetical protein